ncbi:MAG: hypothetical protein RLZZ501_2357 [Pseudomonadota bacterium]|jgi:D-alanyl-D-alanine dipeptidase
MSPLVSITADRFDLDLALAYATPDNFTGRPVYRPAAGCWLHADAVGPLERAIALARPLGLRLRLRDAFRPAEAQWRLWAVRPDPEFLADPRTGSPHSRGVALDLDLLDAASGEGLDLGTGFDAFTPLSHHGRTDLPAAAQRHRALLLGVMVAAGWSANPLEWWHYQLPHARRRYPVLADAVLGAAAMLPA